MLATIVKPPNERQIEYIDKIIGELSRLFGVSKTLEKDFVRKYVEDNDGVVKSVPRLARSLEDLRQKSRKDIRKAEKDQDEIVLPGKDGEGPAPDIK